MSRYFNSFMDNSSEALEHSWGTSPEAKAREKEYNHWYYQKHKDEIEALRKQRIAATNTYQQAVKSHNDASRYASLVNEIYDIYFEYSDELTESDIDMLDKAQKEYTKMYEESKAKSREYKSQVDRQKALADAEAKRILHDMKNPTAKDLAEFYMDTTAVKAKKSAVR